jgi:HD domain
MSDSLLPFGSAPEADDSVAGMAAEGLGGMGMVAQWRYSLCAAYPFWGLREGLPKRGDAVKGTCEKLTTRWHGRVPELNALAGPLLRARAVQRLKTVTFLGILSPRFRGVVDSPLWPKAQQDAVEDGTRYDHTLGVALIALDLARRFDFSERGQRYAVAWGLTHDIGTWPLSHTGEPAFAAITGVSARALRASMVTGGDEVPGAYRLASVLRDLDIDPSALSSLFERDGRPRDDELALFKEVVHSPLTPDTLEGMGRSGAVFGVPVTAPEDVVEALARHRRTAFVVERRVATVLEFWRGKSEIYQRFINREDVVAWESAWSVALSRCCAGVSLADGLEMGEDELVRAVVRSELPATSGVVRYKEPQEYIINGALDALPPEPSVSELWRVLRREPVGTARE